MLRTLGDRRGKSCSSACTALRYGPVMKLGGEFGGADNGTLYENPKSKAPRRLPPWIEPPELWMSQSFPAGTSAVAPPSGAR